MAKAQPTIFRRGGLLISCLSLKMVLTYCLIRAVRRYWRLDCILMGVFYLCEV